MASGQHEGRPRVGTDGLPVETTTYSFLVSICFASGWAFR
jgi:hypothetical protein